MTTATIAPGQHALSFADYHALEAWSSSSLRAMRKGPPARVVWERENPRGDTDATILGSAVHCALLTPDLFDATYAIKPEGMNFSTKEGKLWRDDPCRAGLTLLSHDTGATVDAIVNALLDKPAVAASLDKASARETTLVWQCERSKELCKARPDWISEGYIVDLKVSRHAGSPYLPLRAFSEGWMHQGVHYRSGAFDLGMGAMGCRIVVVEPTAPHFIYTLEVKQGAIELIDLENEATLKALRECRLSGNFPGTPDQWKKIEVPASASFDMANEEETEETETVEVF